MSRTGTPYPYHVLGSQGLSWARRGIASTQERGRYLQKLRSKLEEGCAKYPHQKDLKKLLEDIKKEYLQIAVPQKVF